MSLAQPAHASAGPASPAARIARLRAEATRVQADIDHMNDQIEVVVEQYNANHEALTRTQAAQAKTARRIARAERDLAASRQQLDERVWAVYTGGSRAGAMAELLGATSLHEALTTEKYQEGVVAADQAVIARVGRARLGLEALAKEQAAQRHAQEDLQARLAQQRGEIDDRLAEQRAYLARLTVAVRRAVAAERRRQEELRRRAIARRLAALRAAKIRAERERAAAAAKARAAAAARARAIAAAKSRAAKAGTLRTGAPALVGGRAAGRGGSAIAARATAFALAQVGKPYQWAATGPGSFDCSGLTQAAYRSAGLAIPRVAAAQWSSGQHVDLGDLQRGDLVFFAYDRQNPTTIHHVGMYLGDGLMVEAPFTGADVRVSSIGRSDYIGAVRPTD
jgi:cell wall-associated NlpC family hydrolase